MKRYYERTIEYKQTDTLKVDVIKIVEVDHVPDIRIQFQTPEGNKFTICMPIHDLQITDAVIHSVLGKARMISEMGKEKLYKYAYEIGEKILDMYQTIFLGSLTLISIRVPIIEDDPGEGEYTIECD